MTERRASYEKPTHLTLVVLLLGLIAGPCVTSPQIASAQTDATLSGTWVLDRDASQFPREIGFDADFVPSARGDNDQQSGRRGRRGGGVAGPVLRPQGESYEDGQRRQHLTDEVRNPAARLTIVDTPALVTFTDDKGNTRSVHPDGRAETLTIAGVPVLTVARREAEKLIVLYAVADLRQIRYTYSRPAGTASLAVDVQFLDRNRAGDTVRRVYNTAVTAPAVADSASSAPASPKPPDASAQSKPAVPRAGSEFSGLKRLGLVVEGLSQQATACGLTQQALESAASKPFTDAGIRVSTNSDEDTYIHITVMTSSLPNGMCISRYDWSIYSMTEATLSYQHTPLLAQVVLAHKGGLSGSMPAVHAGDVIRALTEGFTQIAGIIRDANR